MVIMTMVDKVCPLVKEDLSKIYTSRKVKEKVRTLTDDSSSLFTGCASHHRTLYLECVIL